DSPLLELLEVVVAVVAALVVVVAGAADDLLLLLLLLLLPLPPQPAAITATTGSTVASSRPEDRVDFRRMSNPFSIHAVFCRGHGERAASRMRLLRSMPTR